LLLWHQLYTPTVGPLHIVSVAGYLNIGPQTDFSDYGVVRDTNIAAFDLQARGVPAANNIRNLFRDPSKPFYDPNMRIMYYEMGPEHNFDKTWIEPNLAFFKSEEGRQVQHYWNRRTAATGDVILCNQFNDFRLNVGWCLSQNLDVTTEYRQWRASLEGYF
jgi:hypothetical protein